MSKKLSAEILYQVLLLLRQGARAQTIATHGGVERYLENGVALPSGQPLSQEPSDGR